MVDMIEARRVLRQLLEDSERGDRVAGDRMVAAAAAATGHEVMLTVAQVAARLQVSTDTVRRAMIDGRLVGSRVGRVVRISSGAVDRYLASQRLVRTRA